MINVVADVYVLTSSFSRTLEGFTHTGSFLHVPVFSWFPMYEDWQVMTWKDAVYQPSEWTTRMGALKPVLRGDI
jgi:hypothetical protein